MNEEVCINAIKRILKTKIRNMKQGSLLVLKKGQIGLIILVATVAMMGCNSQQKTGSKTNINYESIIEQQRFTFIAQSVNPTEDSRYNPRLMFPNGSNLYQLSSGYDIKITPDSVIAYLPFYGRAYSAPIDPSKGGIQFTSTKFDYKKVIRKQNYEITITPKDAQDVNIVTMTISPAGYAYVSVLSQNRTPISFNGYIQDNLVKP